MEMPPLAWYKGGAAFERKCPHCGQFVKADETVYFNQAEGIADQPNADCKKCGRVIMPFVGWFDEEEE